MVTTVLFRQLITTAALIACIACIICFMKYEKSDSLSQENTARKECVSSLERMASALDFSNLHEYEEHIISSGKQLPCGLSVPYTHAKIKKESLAENGSSFWTMILGNLFGDDRAPERTLRTNIYQNLRSAPKRKNIDEKGTKIEKSMKKLSTQANTTPFFEIGRKVPENSTNLQAVKTRYNNSLANLHVHADLKRAAIRSKSADHLRQNEADSATADEHDFVQNLHGITANAAHSVAERKGILKHLASIKRTKGQLPESVDHLGKHLVLGDISAKKTHDAVQRSDVSPSAKMFSSPVGSKGISSRLANAVNSHDEKTSHDNSADEKTKVKDNGGSVGWIEKLQKEAFRLGYALVRNHESLAESESGGREKNTDHENHKSAESVVLPPMKMLRERESVQNTSIDRVLHVGQSLHTEKTSVRGDPAPTKRDGVRKQNTSSYVSDRIDRDNQIHSMNKEEENSFVWKDSARLQNQARIEAAMHARLQAEAKNSIEHFHSDVISKAVQVFLLCLFMFVVHDHVSDDFEQAQTAAMDAIQRYANVLTFHDREEDKARFEKLALGLSPAERTGDTIRKKVS
jgi:hypothetical protein